MLINEFRLLAMSIIFSFAAFFLLVFIGEKVADMRYRQQIKKFDAKFHKKFNQKSRKQITNKNR